MSALERIVAQVLDLPEDEVSDETGRATTGRWTSLAHLQVIAAVSQELDITITPRQARSCRSVGDLRRLLAENGRPS